MDAKPLPPQDVLHQLLRYEPETGKLFWRERPEVFFSAGGNGAKANASRWNKRHANSEALACLSPEGYKTGNLFGRVCRAHQVIWAMAYGWTADEIDHINGRPSDNRLENLRSVTRQQNTQNQKIRSTNKTGHTGIHWHKRHRKFCACINIAGRQRHIGLFTNIDEAVRARKAAEVQHGYHPNHGRHAQ